MNDFDDNIFNDKDDALDYIIYEESEEQGKKPDSQNTGCLGLFLLMVVPSLLIWLI